MNSLKSAKVIHLWKTVPSSPLTSFLSINILENCFYSFVGISAPVVYLWSRWMECKMFFKLSSQYEGCTALVTDVLVGFVRMRLFHVRAQRTDLWVGTFTVWTAQHALVPISTLCVWNYPKQSEYNNYQLNNFISQKVWTLSRPLKTLVLCVVVSEIINDRGQHCIKRQKVINNISLNHQKPFTLKISKNSLNIFIVGLQLVFF